MRTVLVQEVSYPQCHFHLTGMGVGTEERVVVDLNMGTALKLQMLCKQNELFTFLLKENFTFQIAVLCCSNDYVCFCPELLLLLEKF